MFFSLLMCSQFYVRITADDKLMCYGRCGIYTHKLLASVLFYYFPRLRWRNRAFLTVRVFAERKKKNKSLCFVHFLQITDDIIIRWKAKKKNRRTDRQWSGFGY